LRHVDRLLDDVARRGRDAGNRRRALVLRHAEMSALERLAARGEFRHEALAILAELRRLHSVAARTGELLDERARDLDSPPLPSVAGSDAGGEPDSIAAPVGHSSAG
jgi:hypothetical protein